MSKSLGRLHPVVVFFDLGGHLCVRTGSTGQLTLLSRPVESGTAL